MSAEYATLPSVSLQAESETFTASRVGRTPADFPPASLAFLLPADVWPKVRELLDADKDLTLADIFGAAVSAWLDDCRDPDEGDDVTEPTRFTVSGDWPEPPPTSTPPRPLSGRQTEILGFIRERIGRSGQSPTVREIGERFGLRSTNAVSNHLDALQRKGAIHRDPFEARGIRIVSEGGVACS